MMSLRWKIAQKAELKWWKNYLKGKSPEEYLNWKQNYWQQFLKQINLPETRGLQILDAGCGPAGIFTILENNQVTAIDPLIDAYQNDIEHFKVASYPWVDFQNLSLEQLDHKDRYDVIFCINAINHVADLQLAYDRLIQSLKPGGSIVLSIDAHNFLLLKKIFQWLPGDILHPHQYDKTEYLQFLQKRGVKKLNEYRLDQAFIFDYWVIVGEKIEKADSGH